MGWDDLDSDAQGLISVLGVIAAAGALAGIVMYVQLDSSENCLSPYVKSRIDSKPAKMVFKHVRKDPLEKVLESTRLEKESKLVKEESLKVLHEFEMIDYES